MILEVSREKHYPYHNQYEKKLWKQIFLIFCQYISKDTCHYFTDKRMWWVEILGAFSKRKLRNFVQIKFVHIHLKNNHLLHNLMLLSCMSFVLNESSFSDYNLVGYEIVLHGIYYDPLLKLFLGFQLALMNRE